MDMRVYQELARKWVKSQSDKDYLILSKFLDEYIGKKRVKKRWKYNVEDKSTWLFIDCDVNYATGKIESWKVNEPLRRKLGIRYV